MTAKGEIYWISKGHPSREQPSCEDDRPVSDCLLHHQGCVRIVTGQLGTEVKWDVFSPCYASLYYVCDWLADLRAPVMLRYFLAGWFEELCDTTLKARRRIEEILSRSDIHLMRRVFVREFDPASWEVPPLLQDAWLDGNVSTDYSVDCVYEESSGRFRVDRIGPKSTIARLWGMTPVSYPCLNGGSYDKTVSAAYADVLKHGRPRYDHVYAAMQTPDNAVLWIPYQRVILPKPLSGSRPAVAIVTEIAKVGIHIV